MSNYIPNKQKKNKIFHKREVELRHNPEKGRLLKKWRDMTVGEIVLSYSKGSDGP